VSIHTLLETGKGEQQEGFDIFVHDGQTGDAKRVGLMSGGERTWVEACLTRAIALYLATHTGVATRRCSPTRQTGHWIPTASACSWPSNARCCAWAAAREFFASRTLELTAVADAVIDLEAMKVAACLQGDGVGR
jgi:exonuclease SbcC